MKMTATRILTTTARRVRTLSALTAIALMLGSLALPSGTRASQLRYAAPVNVFALSTFSSGSLVIPMDSGANGQDNGMLRAYGLVYELLRRGVPVNWVIDPAKPSNGTDFAINGITATAQDFRTGAVLSSRNYAGGPFVIDAANAAAATPIIVAWQATAGDATAVHRITGGSTNVEVNRTLVAAPRIAILKDGYEAIAFNNLNAAGIRDSQGSAWSSSSPDLLSEAAVAGPSSIVHNDGALIHQSNGLPRYAHFTAMHYIPTAITPEVVAETRSWLDSDSLVHAFLQCEAARAFENSGSFLTTNGIIDDGDAPTTEANRSPSNTLTQIDGAFEADSGSVDSIGLSGGSSFKTGVMTLFNDSLSGLDSRILMLGGRLDGDSSNGRVTYLAGHDYSLALPVSTNPQTNGVRLMLNTIFSTDAAAAASSDVVSVSTTAPSTTNTSQISYTINYSTTGSRPAENLTLTDALPPGTAYVVGSATVAPSSNTGGVLTWNLPPLAAGGSGSITFSVSVTADGTYTNRSVLNYSNLTVGTITSAPAATVRDTVPPGVAIVSGPIGPTNDSTPTFQFTVGADAVTTLCSIDNIGYTPCSASYTSALLPDGPHIFYVRATDNAGNTGTATLSFTVDTVPPMVTIILGPTGSTNITTPVFQFTASPDAVTNQCAIDNAGFTACSPSPASYTSAPLANGPHTFYVRATDAAGNTATATRSFSVNATVLVSITVVPSNSSIPAGLTQQFTAVGTYSDGTNQDLTATVVWSSTLNTVASISNAVATKGLATGITVGTTQIRATLGSVVGATNLTVTSPVLVAISVTPASSNVAPGLTRQFTATGNYSNGTNQNLTAAANWTSSNQTTAAVSNTAATKGLATGYVPGVVTISATVGSVTGTANLTVTGTLKSSKQAVRAEINTALSAATSNKDKNDLKDVIKKLDKSLDSGLWKTDGNHLDCNRGNKVFGREKQAVKQLMAMLANTGASSVSDAAIQRWINTLVAIDRRLAEIAVTEATVSPQTRAAALEQIARGDDDLDDGDFDKAITHYKRAWKMVRVCNGDDDDEDDDDNCGRHDH